MVGHNTWVDERKKSFCDLELRVREGFEAGSEGELHLGTG